METIKIRWTLLTLLFYVSLAAVVPSGGAAAAACPNEDARTGFSAALPSCRAYELVSPPDSDGQMLEAVSTYTNGFPFDLFPTELASPLHDSFMYMTYAGALKTPAGGTGIHDVYVAKRTTAGWHSRLLPSPAEGTLAFPTPGGASPDHNYAFVNVNGNGYLQGPAGEFELIGIGSAGTEPSVQGRYISANGDHVIFNTGKQPENEWCQGCPVKKLESNAPPAGTAAIYDRAADGPTRVVSLLPGNTPPAEGKDATFNGVSRDGKVVAFTIGDTLYVRVDNAETVPVQSGDPVYAGISADGRFVFFVIAGVIHRFDVESEVDTPANPGTEGVIVNISADGSHVYFISESALDGGAVGGQPNMYDWADGTITFVATVAASDLVQTSGSLVGIPSLTNWTEYVANRPPGGGAGIQQGPGNESSRSTPDGHFLVFESKASLTGFDNEGHSEIYRYDADLGELLCVSCNFRGGTTTSDSRMQDLSRVKSAVIVHNVTEDGGRVFFETGDALVPRDTDGINDIYEWRTGEAGGSVDLITSGVSPGYILPLSPGSDESPASNFAPLPNRLLGVTPDGSDVFFTAKEALVPGAGEAGTQAIYVARVGGGFATPQGPPICNEQDCRPPSKSWEQIVSPSASEVNRGSGNVKARSCQHGQRSKHKQRRRCTNRHARGGRASSVELNDKKLAPDRTAERLASIAATGASEPSPEVKALEPTAPCGVEAFNADLSDAVAGASGDFITTINLNSFSQPGGLTAACAVNGLSLTLPPGLVGNPQATPRCSMGDFTSYGNCSSDSQIGVTNVRVGDPLFENLIEPVFNLQPPHPESEIARIGFVAYLYPISISISVRTSGDYAVVGSLHGAPGLGALVRSKTTIWANPASPAHDKQRATTVEVPNCPLGVPCEVPEGRRPSTIPESERKSFLSNPGACQDGQVGLEIFTYQFPGEAFPASAPLDPITGCTGLPFAPSFEAEPTSHEAGAPTGLKTKLLLPQHLGEGERATSTMREARVTLPEGMQVAAGAANWIGTCSDAQVGYHKEVDTNCPDSSKLGTATFISPALSVPIEGTIYQRAPEPGRQLGLWLTADALGLHIKLPGSLEPDKTTGRLTAVFTDLPQVPVSEIDLNVWGGPRAPLQNPDRCGTFTTDFTFTPHSNDPAASGQSTMQITEGCNQPFDPALHAGVTDPLAGKYSPFVFDLTRPDGNQALRGFELHLPDGELAKLKGVPLCGDDAASSATCPQGSRIGHLQATTGPGPEPFTLPEPGKPSPQIYLSGPYQGSPFSIVSEVPARAGPFDLGTLAVRSGLGVEPETGRAVVKADPLPQFFEGVGIAYRHLHAVVDRPEFSLNPTDCREMAVSADATSTKGTVAHPQARFQVDGCKALKFGPKLSLALKGGTGRADYPALTAVLKARKGDANIASASVALPHSEFLAQQHIGTICTRVQFAADKCPKGSVYGRARAITPLLDKPLSGPVYLRSSNHPLPDLVAKLGGQLEIDLVGRIDSIHGGIRTTFESVPDAPVSKFVLQMRGGRKGLLTNSTDICRGSHRATVAMKAQNGRAARLRPVLVAGGCGKSKPHKHEKHHR